MPHVQPNMRDEESKPGFQESKPGKEMKKWCQGRSTPCIGDGKPPTFNRESLFHGYINPYYWVDEFIPYYMEIMGV